MGFDQYHEPPEELPEETRTFARLCASLTEEAEAIGWYEQRLARRAGPRGARRHGRRGRRGVQALRMDLEFLLRRKPKWREIAQGVLFQEGDIVEHGEAAEAAAGDEGDADGDVAPSRASTARWASAPAGGGAMSEPSAARATRRSPRRAGRSSTRRRARG